MATHTLGLNLVTLRDGLTAGRLGENLGRARQAGFRAVGIWVQTLADLLDAGADIDGLAAGISDLGLSVDELCFVPVLDDDGRVADQRRVFERAARLGAGVVVSIYGKPDNPLEQVQQDWAEFVDLVGETGVSPAFEFIGPWERYNSPLEAWRVIEAGPEAGRMVFDTFHFWRGGCRMGEFDLFPAESVGIVHLNDARDVPREVAVDADRTYPGEGVIPLGEILRRLDGGGFRGPVSVEIFGEIQKREPDEVAAHAFKTARATLAALEGR